MEAPESLRSGFLKCPECGMTNPVPDTTQNTRLLKVRNIVLLISLVGVLGLGTIFIVWKGKSTQHPLATPSILRSANPQKHRLKLPDLIALVKPGVVLIRTYSAIGEMVSTGTGFFIDDDKIVTNLHVVKNAYAIDILSSDGNLASVYQYWTPDNEGDLIILKIDPDQYLEWSWKPVRLQITSELPREGEDIVVIGNPLGLSDTVSQGIVSSLRPVQGLGTIIQITAPISPGSSGSPIMNMRGEVVAVATLQMIKGQNLNFGSPVDRLRNIDTTLDPITVSPPSIFNRAFEYYRRDRPQEALSLFMEATKKYPNNTAAWTGAGLSAYALKKYKDAIEFQSKAIDCDHANATAYYGRGASYLQNQQYLKSENDLLQAIKLNPEFTEAYFQLGVVYYAKNKGRQFKEVLAKLKSLDPERAKTLTDILGG